jgi:hypothetical protein
LRSLLWQALGGVSVAAGNDRQERSIGAHGRVPIAMTAILDGRSGSVGILAPFVGPTKPLSGFPLVGEE